MSTVSLRHDEASALLSAVVSYQMELEERMSDCHGILNVREQYGEDCAVTDEDVAQANAELDELEAIQHALDRAAQKIARTRKGRPS